MTKLNLFEFYEYLLIYTTPGENKIFFVMDQEDVACVLTNAAYKLEENIVLTNLEERLREEIGFAGRCFVREYCNSLEEWDKLESVPYPLHSDVTIQQLTELLKEYNAKQTQTPSRAVTP